MPLSERLTRVDKARFWKDSIPLHYEYTAGIAGEKFLRGLQEGRILASRCSNCGKKYLPPKAYCVDCFERISNFAEVGPEGTVAALTESHVTFGGGGRSKPELIAFITFRGTTGGLLHSVSGRGLAVGTRVAPRFKPKNKRSGSMLDIEVFAPVRS